MTKEEALKACTVDGNLVKLPAIQLERKTYLEVAKALNLIGGKWKGSKVQAFVFATDPTDLLASIQGGENRNLKKEFQFFATPPDLAKIMIREAKLEYGHSVLEPSAGQGALLEAIQETDLGLRPDCYELMETNRIILQQKKDNGLSMNILGEDFLIHNARRKYDRIIANPPFSKNQDIDHIMKMVECLNPGGRIVSVASMSWTFGSQKKQESFKRFILNEDPMVTNFECSYVEIERETFKESGTLVPSTLITINKIY